MGAPVTPDRVVSSARATAALPARARPGRPPGAGARGGRPRARAARRRARGRHAGHGRDAHDARRPSTAATAAGAPDAVVVGLDPNLTYLRLAAAADCIRAGARFIATNRDPIYPTERGLRPGAGSIVAALEATTGVTPLSIGKPAPLLLEIAAEAVGRDPHEAVMIGDGIGTDLARPRAVGARSVLMLTGVTTAPRSTHCRPTSRPTAVAADAAELAAVLERFAGD